MIPPEHFDSDDERIAWRNERLTEWANRRALHPDHIAWLAEVRRQIETGDVAEGLDAEGIRERFRASRPSEET